MYQILKLNEISPVIDSVFGKNYKAAKDIADPDAIILRSFKMHDYEMKGNLLAVARAGAGVNNIPIDKCTERGVVVFNTPGANANAVKELVLCNMLLSSRKIVPAIEWANSLKGKGAEVAGLVEKGKSQFVGGEILGKKLGVIGLGAIGAQVANAASDLGMEVLGYDPFISIDGAWNLYRSIRKITDLNELLKEADYITLHVPLTDGTRSIINKESLAKMKDGVAIINCSRGELVDNGDILAAVAAGKVARYVTDFPCEELLGVENVIAVPHLGASTPEAEDNCAEMAARELVDFLENGNINNSVNYPACSMPRSTQHRITVLHKNVKSMISQMTDAISKMSGNIENMMNTSKGDAACSIFDVCEAPSKELIAALEKIEGVTKVRVIK